MNVLSCLVGMGYTEARLRDPGASAHRLRIARLVDGWTARHLTTHIHANSHAVKAAAIRDLGVAAEKVTVIEGGRDPMRLGRPDPERRRRSRRSLGLRDDDEVLVNVGRQDHPKGQWCLLDAVADLARRRPNLRLLIVGRPGNVSERLKTSCVRSGLDGQVQFLGHRQDVPEILAAADLFVFPSLYEGLPGAVIEAMALGLPVVASDIASHRELLEPGRNGVLVDPESPAALAAAIEALLDDRETLRAFARRSVEIFESRFTLDCSIRRKADLYRALGSASPVRVAEARS